MYVFVALCICRFFFFFFKQKTAYEMRISDWSSDVCSSDLADGIDALGRLAALIERRVDIGYSAADARRQRGAHGTDVHADHGIQGIAVEQLAGGLGDIIPRAAGIDGDQVQFADMPPAGAVDFIDNSEKRCLGKQGVRTS